MELTDEIRKMLSYMDKLFLKETFLLTRKKIEEVKKQKAHLDS